MVFFDWGCINYSEQLNVSIRYVDNDYDVHEDLIGLFVLPNAGAETITSVVKDILLRCTLPIDLCIVDKHTMEQL